MISYRARDFNLNDHVAHQDPVGMGITASKVHTWLSGRRNNTLISAAVQKGQWGFQPGVIFLSQSLILKTPVDAPLHSV